MGTATFLTVVIVVGLIVGVLYALAHPYRDCKHCDGGKLHNFNRSRYGKGCAGGRFGRGSCYEAGEHLAPEVKLLRKVGIGTSIEDPVAKARGK